MSKTLFLFALVALLAISPAAINPVYPIDGARVTYTMTVTATGNPLSVSYTISDDITISPAGVAVVDVDTGDIPIDWTDNISDEERSLFILTSAEIAAKAAVVNGAPMVMVEGKATGLVPYFGASILTSTDAQGDYRSVIWSKATGIVLAIHAETDFDGTNAVLDVVYQSSNVNIYSDLNAFEQAWNTMVAFFTTTTGIIVLVAIIAAAAIAIGLGIYFGTKKKKHVHHRRRK